jgi:5'/3'-nucleotidase SurE
VKIENGFEGIAVDGRPADCVKLAVKHLLPRKPDLVVSGLNEGANVGINVIYSGTVAAAIEGRVSGVRKHRGLAASAEGGSDRLRACGKIRATRDRSRAESGIRTGSDRQHQRSGAGARQ